MDGKNCIRCEHFEPVGDGFGLCVEDALPVTVYADYEPTKNYLKCLKDKSVKQMWNDGWCKDCSGDPKICNEQKECEGYRRFNENTN